MSNRDPADPLVSRMNEEETEIEGRVGGGNVILYNAPPLPPPRRETITCHVANMAPC